LQSYGQKDPLVEYKREAFEMFRELLSAVEANVARTIFKVEVQAAPAPQLVEKRPLEYDKPDPDRVGDYDSKELEKIEEEVEENPKSKARNSKQIENSNDQISNNSGVTTTIREPGGKTIHDRMMASSGPQGTIKSGKKVGRNEPCPCGSGKKYKKCCGR
jgi:preprotein translocase subunit SecA